jgi:hypothetical protein
VRLRLDLQPSGSEPTRPGEIGSPRPPISATGHVTYGAACLQPVSPVVTRRPGSTLPSRGVSLLASLLSYHTPRVPSGQGAAPSRPRSFSLDSARVPGNGGDRPGGRVECTVAVSPTAGRCSYTLRPARSFARSAHRRVSNTRMSGKGRDAHHGRGTDGQGRFRPPMHTLED